VNVNEGYPEITRILFSPDGKQLATTGKLKGVSVWNVQTGELQHEIQLQHGSDALAFAPDGNLLAAVQDRAPERHTIKLCDPHRGEIVASMIGHTSMIDCLAFSHDGITLASAGEDGIRFWNVATRERVGILEGVQTKFTTLCFSGDGKTLVAADRLGCLHFWHTPQDERKALVPAKP
jgi:WD40 repeat protein